jgi:hypothetical protein
MTTARKRFRIVEYYPQATVRRTLIVEAPTLEDAKESPWEHTVLREETDIDWGGEAVTEEAEAFTGTLTSKRYVSRLRTRGAARG